MTDVTYSSEVIKIDFQNKEINDKLKTVFWAKSASFPEKGRLCIQWGPSYIDMGDKFDAQGKVTPDGTFIVYSIMTYKNGS